MRPFKIYCAPPTIISQLVQFLWQTVEIDPMGHESSWSSPKLCTKMRPLDIVTDSHSHSRCSTVSLPLRHPLHKGFMSFPILCRWPHRLRCPVSKPIKKTAVKQGRKEQHLTHVCRLPQSMEWLENFSIRFFISSRLKLKRCSVWRLVGIWEVGGVLEFVCLDCKISCYGVPYLHRTWSGSLWMTWTDQHSWKGMYEIWYG